MVKIHFEYLNPHNQIFFLSAQLYNPIFPETVNIFVKPKKRQLCPKWHFHHQFGRIETKTLQSNLLLSQNPEIYPVNCEFFQKALNWVPWYYWGTFCNAIWVSIDLNGIRYKRHGICHLPQYKVLPRPFLKVLLHNKYQFIGKRRSVHPCALVLRFCEHRKLSLPLAWHFCQ